MTLRKFCLLLILISASTLADGNRYRPMAESMLDMMDAFSSALQRHRDGQDGLSGPWGSGNGDWAQAPPRWGNPMSLSPWSMYGGPMSPGNFWGPSIPGPKPDSFSGYGGWLPAPPANPNLSRVTPLEGNWQGRSGEILSIRNGRFRIYRSPQQRQEGYIRLLDDQRLLLEPQGGMEIHYEYALKDGRMVLRDRQQNLLLFRRLATR